MTVDQMRPTSPGTPEEWLVWKDKLLKALQGQGISMEPQWYKLPERC